MAKHVLTDASLWLDGYDLSGDMNALSVVVENELLDSTAFKDGSRTRVAGYKAVSFGHSGYWNGGTDEVDDALFTSIGLVDKLSSFCQTGTEGETAFSFQSAIANYNPAGSVGDVFGFQVNGQSSGDGVFLRGTLIGNKTAIAASASGSEFQIGALGATDTLYAGLHVTKCDGTSPTLDVKVQSDTTGFASPTDRITFAQKTAIGSEWLSLGPGAITDDYFRIDYTISGTSPDIDFAVICGIVAA